MLCLEPPKRKECEGACSRGAGGESINGPSRNQQQKKSERMNEREREKHVLLVTRPAQPFRYCLRHLMALFLLDNPLTTKREASEEKKAFFLLSISAAD
ncbi:hypothetical protein CDAR_40191 [Caerostris darwini]|uniref:Uncharacterized protein n=1 Tax=Caerostris darwini TaxID=1538125 RepID=A0AAV4RB01_9ARAC|nr:hypothetical protein CDAR_40191 [Caerostris darwini]